MWTRWISDSTRDWFSRGLIGCFSHCWSVETLFHHSGRRTWSGSRSRGARSRRQTWSCGRSRRSGHRPCGWTVVVCSLPRSALPAPYSSRIADEASCRWERENKTKEKRCFTTSFKSGHPSRSWILIKHFLIISLMGTGCFLIKLQSLQALNISVIGSFNELSRSNITYKKKKDMAMLWKVFLRGTAYKHCTYCTNLVLFVLTLYHFKPSH